MIGDTLLVERYVRHIARRLKDDGLLHTRACPMCRLILRLPIDEQHTLILRAADRAREGT